MSHRRSPFLLMSLTSFLGLAGDAVAQPEYSLRSPDQRIEVKVRPGSRIRYDVLVNGRAVLQDSTMSINVDQNLLGRDAKVAATRQGSRDQTLDPAVRQKFARIREHYNELRIETDAALAVVFRAYNEGVAYRLETSLPKDQVKVFGEEAAFNFAGDYTVFYGQEDSFFSHNERQ